jgi:Uma2 family endonuclease
MTVREYLSGREEKLRSELLRGFLVREPAAPFFSHQAVVTRTTVLLDEHVRAQGLGVVCVSPIDVILDEPNAIVVQPDVVFVSTERVGIIRNQIWGAPDLVVEVISPRTARRDRTSKLKLYRQFGVQEYWIMDHRSVTVVPLQIAAARRRRLTGNAMVRSAVIAGFQLPARSFFDA